MRVIFAPWRMAYIGQKKPSKCFFCEKSRQKKDRENYILSRAEEAFVIMNTFPYNNGHLLIAPFRHVTNVKDITDGEWRSLIVLLRKSVVAVKKALGPDGFNIGMNIGRVAGAGAEHLHIHVVPRWAGDTSFMPVISEVKVIPEHLWTTYDRLVKALKG